MCGFENKLENDSVSKCGFESKLKNVSEDNINFKINEKNNILAIISLKIISKNVIRNLTMFKEYKEKKVSKHNIYSLECIFLSLYMPSLPSSPHYLLSLSISIYLSIYLSIFLFTLCNWESSLLISKSFSFIFKPYIHGLQDGVSKKGPTYKDGHRTSSYKQKKIFLPWVGFGLSSAEL